MPLSAQRLRQVREQRGLTQRQLGELCGITLYQISRYETNKSDISGDSLEALSRSLDVSSDYLLGLSQQTKGQLGDSQLNEEELAILDTFRRDRWPGLIRFGAAQLRS
jgi:transcriptional regulator with XRE-family HTH domain